MYNVHMHAIYRAENIHILNVNKKSVYRFERSGLNSEKFQAFPNLLSYDSFQEVHYQGRGYLIRGGVKFHR